MKGHTGSCTETGTLGRELSKTEYIAVGTVHTTAAEAAGP